jgi:hypothetical protein
MVVVVAVVAVVVLVDAVVPDIVRRTMSTWKF